VMTTSAVDSGRRRALARLGDACRAWSIASSPADNGQIWLVNRLRSAGMAVVLEFGSTATPNAKTDADQPPDLFRCLLQQGWRLGDGLG